MTNLQKVKCLLLVLIIPFITLYGCSINISPNVGNNSADMTPRLISLSGEMNTAEVVENVKSAIVGIKSVIANGYSVGSGVAIREGGYILTNQHVVSGTRGITLYFADQSTAGATLIWQDSSVDLAVIKSNVDMPYLECQNDNIKVGQDVIAIGTPLSLAFGHSVTKGIVSALDRTLEISNQDGSTSYMQNLIQHDASINPGNSGGPLINASGKVIGINTLKATDAEGIGFAIPIETGESIVNKLSANNGYSAPYMGVMGISTDYARSKSLEISNKGFYVLDVAKNSVCAIAGVMAGDIIYQMDNTPINDYLDLRSFIYSCEIGDQVTVYLYRGGTPITLNITLGKR